MASGLSVAIALAAQAAGATPAGSPHVAAVASAARTYGPVAPAAPKKAAPRQSDACANADKSGDQRTIVICAQRPNGYRLNPDVMEAKREIRSGGPPPPRRGVRPDCATVGPAGCFNAGINLVAAAITAVTMVERAVKGQNVGQMFVTDPHPDEYHLYLEAKQRREQREAEAAAAKAKADAAAAAEAKQAVRPPQQ